MLLSWYITFKCQTIWIANKAPWPHFGGPNLDSKVINSLRQIFHINHISATT